MALTSKQKRVLDYIKRYTKRKGLAPTYEEIARGLGVSKATVHGHVMQLSFQGLLKRERYRARSFSLPEPEPPRFTLPLLGIIQAGSPIEAVADEERLDLSELLPLGKECFALKVRGVSMIDEQIRDGDLVIVERRPRAEPGETVVAILDQEQATLKKFYPEGRRIRLQPANEELEPIVVDSGRVEIQGVVCGVVRRYH